MFSLKPLSPGNAVIPSPNPLRNFLSCVVFATLYSGTAEVSAQNQRALGLDISAWQGNISQTTWNNLRNVENRQFVFLRSSRGGTTGYYDQTDASNTRGNNTLSQRYDDPYFIQNINRAINAGMFAGSYHFSRPDIIATTLKAEGIPNNGTDEADHFIQMAGPWMRPGYLVPVHDLEAGINQRSGSELTQFAVDFSNRMYERMRIRPAIYIGGNYANYVQQNATASLRNQLAQPPSAIPSMVSPACSVLWSARWPNQSDPNSIDVQNGHPKDSYTPIYGPWDDYGTTHPWKFWQYASTGRLQSFNSGNSNLDFDVAQGGVEFLKDQMVPAVWWHDGSGDWTTLTNWNSGQQPVAPVTGPGQVPPVATTPLPTPSLPSVNDTIILERPSADVTVTLSSGNHQIRKLYARESLNITGGSLTINYVPSWDSTPIAAQFSSPVSLSGGATLAVHTLQVDSTRTFTVTDSTLKFSQINLMPGATPAKLAVNGNMSFASFTNNGASTIANGTGSGSSGNVDLAGGNRQFDIATGTDLTVAVPVSNGAMTKIGNGIMRLNSANTYAGGTTISAGTLLANNASGSGTGTGSVAVNGGALGGTGSISGAVTIGASGTVAPGTPTSTGTLTFNGALTLTGTSSFKVNRNNGTPVADRIARSSGLAFGGSLVIVNSGSSLQGGEVFTLFAAPSYSGAFTTTNLPGLNGGLNWHMANLGINGTIRVNRHPVVDGITVTNVPGQVIAISKASLINSAADDDADTLTLLGFDAMTTNGVVLSSDSTHIYYLNNANVADRFNFTISDGCGGNTAGVAQIAPNPSTAPAISTHPQPATVIAGQTATFSVGVTGTQPMSYQWKKGVSNLSNGGNIAGASSATLTISNTSAADAANYSVVITNVLGTTTSAEAALTVNYSLTPSINGPGTVSKDPDQASYAAGSTVTLTATPSANAMFVNWTGDALSFENPLTLTMDGNMNIVANFSGLGEVDDIIIDNSDSSATFVGSWQTGTSSTDKFGANYHFASTALGGTSNVTYRPLIATAGNYDVFIWYPQGSNRATNCPWTVVYDGGSTNVAVNQISNGGKWVLIASAKPFAVGLGGYVQLSNDSTQLGKVVMADAVKFVYSAIQGVPPTITSQPQDASAIVGEDATFSVSVFGDPSTYQWRLNGVNIPGAIASSYTRTNCQIGDAGEYSVAVTNDSGGVISSNATLTVYAPPTIDTQPLDKTVVAGNNAVFSVSASGTETLHYQWRFNEGAISGATANTYTVVNAQAGHAGDYSVRVTNSYGQAISSDAALVVNVPPSISAHPLTQSAVQTSNVTFSVTASGTAPLRYQWRFNSTNIPGATASFFSRTNVQPNHAGAYSVRVTNVAGILISEDAVLTVNIPASISAAPLDLTVIQSSNAVFNVSASGTAPLRYQWKFNNNPLAGATTSTYTRVNSQTNHAGTYSVTVTNDYGTANADAVLTVIVPLSITTPPQSITVGENASAAFNVVATGTAPLSYQWRFNGVNILDATDSEYTIADVASGDAGNYSVIITNNAGAITSSVAALTVSSAPIINVHPIPATNVVGTSVQFSVGVSGSAPLSYRWQKGTNDLSDGPNISGAGSATLTINPLSLSDAASYRVVVTNLAGSATSSGAALTVRALPTITVQPTSRTGYIFSNTTFTVKATGSSPLTYQWRFNGGTVPGATSSSYIKAGLQLTDTGNYLAVVTDMYGSTTSSVAVLTVMYETNRPRVSIISPKANIAYSNSPSLLLQGTATDNARVQSVLYKLNNNGDFSNATVNAGIGSASNFNATLWPTPGTNILQVKAIDWATNVSLVSTVKFYFNVWKPFTLSTNGEGSIKPTTNAALGTPLNGASLLVGRSYRLTAVDVITNGYIFTNWTYSAPGIATNKELQTNKLVLDFIMRTNLSITANFIPNPFRQYGGLYNGLFRQEDKVRHGTAGFITMRVTERCGVSGKLLLDGNAVPFSGKFRLEGAFDKTLIRSKFDKSAINLSLTLDFAGATHAALGAVTCPTEGWTSSISADRAIWTTNLHETADQFTNAYTMAIPGALSPEDGPSGYGYGAVTIDKLGNVRFTAAALSDGRLISQTTKVSKNGAWPLFVALYPQKRLRTNNVTMITETRGELFGWLDFLENSEAGTTNLAPQGTVSWIKTGWTNTTYQSGFTNEGPVVSSAWLYPPNRPGMVMSFADGLAVLAEGDLSEAFAANVFLSANNVLSAPLPLAHNLKAKLGLKTGIISGTFTHPITGKTAQPWAGVFLQDHHYGLGFFMSSTNSGNVVVIPQ